MCTVGAQLWSRFLRVVRAGRAHVQDRAETGESLRTSPPSPLGFLLGLSLLILNENADPRKASLTLSMLGSVLIHTQQDLGREGEG